MGNEKGNAAHGAPGSSPLTCHPTMPLGEIELGQDNGPVGDGGSGARKIAAPDNSNWIAKATYFGGHPHRYFYLNEALVKLIAERLDVRVPDAAVLRLTPEQAEAFRPGR